MPIPTPRQRMSSVESQVLVTSQSSELVSKTDPQTVPTSEANIAGDVLVEEPVGLTEAEDIVCVPEADNATNSSTVHALEDLYKNNVRAVDLSYSVQPQATVSSAESVDCGRCSRFDATELPSTPLPESECSVRDAADCDKSVRRSSESYLPVWTCVSRFSVVETGLPLQRDTIKSDESFVFPSPVSPPASASSDINSVVFCSPPVPKKRSITQLSACDPSSPSLVQSSAASTPPSFDSELGTQAGNSKRKTDQGTSIVVSEVATTRSELSGLPSAPGGDSNIPLHTESMQPLSSEEEQIMTMSFPSHDGNISSPPVGAVSVAPRPRPRVSPRLPVLPDNSVFSLPPGPARLPPLVMPTSIQHSSSSTPTTARSPLDKVIAVGGVNVLGMSAGGIGAARNTPKTSTSSELSSPGTPGTCGTVTPDSTRTPPVPPPKQRKPSDVKSVVTAFDGDTTDEELDSSDSKC